MRQASAQLRVLLASNQFLMADLYTFTLISGTVLTYTDADINLKMNGVTYLATDAKIQRKGTKLQTGMTVNSIEIDVYAGVNNLVNGIPMLQAISTGAFDSADVIVQRVFMATWGDTSAGSIILFTGRVSDATATRTSAALTVKSYLDLLNINMPRNLYQASCSNSLYGLGCGVNREAVAVSATAGAGSTASTVKVATSKPDGWFNQGYSLFTGGQNAGLRRTIKVHASGQVLLAAPLPYPVSAGDTMKLYPGCDHTQATCINKFGNGARWRAMPFIPVPETAT
ncbi:DUF2163 domain-containing protein [Paludibacterium purpuratum]|uniref:Putative phage protein (TIGR02218 family) n=1 Tax=Paludibacterium purpuratum TaxID=1144873 RepID=A0A4R7BDF1_9NEIS|nr:DUF2163 domain-containing protein [Paludibacterium purpuratum]TDR82212.1 putative phage protein (TIGR02218 family) [Paludibacterium purpuratum]